MHKRDSCSLTSRMPGFRFLSRTNAFEPKWEPVILFSFLVGLEPAVSQFFIYPLENRNSKMRQVMHTIDSHIFFIQKQFHLLNFWCSTLRSEEKKCKALVVLFPLCWSLPEEKWTPFGDLYLQSSFAHLVCFAHGNPLKDWCSHFCLLIFFSIPALFCKAWLQWVDFFTTWLEIKYFKVIILC